MAKKAAERACVIGEIFGNCYAIMDSIADGVFTVDFSRRIHFFNRAAERITGFSRQEAMDKYCFDIFRANICQINCALEETFATARELVNIAAIIINKEGEEIPINISTALLRSEDGEVLGGVGVFRDLTVEETLRKELSKSYSFQDMISKNPKMQRIFGILPDVAESEVSVLIQGESGTGKELLARAIHALSPRSRGPMVEVNCAAIPETLLESELFGYLKGAFTDAKRDKPGRLATAAGGTLFLDEISEAPSSTQVKLLRVLEEKLYVPLGGTEPIKADVRIVAAANRDLAQMVEEGTFREDLYYRLNVVKIELPPLSERKEDIPLLIDHIIHRLNVIRSREVIGLSEEALGLLIRYDLPGNIRELENILEYAFILCKGQIIELEHLPEDLRRKVEASSSPSRTTHPMDFIEAQIIREALDRHRGNRLMAAQELNISRSTLWRRMKKYGLFH
ncbi:MAG: sigma 54-interacting transcriptional regulator [Deltaproteobacteria bacterium]|nr:sigma 54-interacting transcriptional regulator [Deltaproteobacteria bacterium]